MQPDLKTVVFFLLLIPCTLISPGLCYVDGDVRLVGATDSLPLGRLEVFMDGEWGTVCSVSRGAAESACHQLGYQGVAMSDTVINLDVAKASNDTPIVLSDVDCEYDPFGDGPELHILRCSYSKIISADCTHNDDAAIQCVMEKTIDNPYEFQVDLVGGESPSSGLLKVYASNQWGTVCSSKFTSATADSACRQLGYTNSLSFSGAQLSQDPVWTESTTCTKSQPCLKDCYGYPTDSHSSCSEIVFLNCTFEVDKQNLYSSGSVSLCTFHDVRNYTKLYVGISAGVVAAVALTLSIISILVYVFYIKRHRQGYTQLKS